MEKQPIPVALEAPETACTPLDNALLSQVIELSRKSPRKRIIQRLHGPDDAPLQRMLNAMQPGSYLRPHRHMNPPKAETFVMLQGAIRTILFDDNGVITDVFDMRAQGSIFGVDIEPGVWHGFFVLEPDSVVFETKNGPYAPASDKDFAQWAPKEHSRKAQQYLAQLKKRSDIFLEKRK